MKHEESEQKIEWRQVYQNPCEDCGSSDAGVLYYYPEGHAKAGKAHHFHCFACYKHIWYEGNNKGTTMEQAQKEQEELNNVVSLEAVQDAPEEEFLTGNFEELSERGLSKETCKKFDIQFKRGKDNRAAYVFNYYDAAGEIVAQKIRNFNNKDEMKIRGKVKKAVLFGQQAFPAGGKYVTVTVGEFDAPAVFQMTGSKWPAVSIKNGDQSAIAELQKEQVWKWLDSFDNIVLCFDADDSGQKAIADIIKKRIINFSKLKIMKMRHKDANEYLLKGDAENFIKDWWDASKYIPKNILKASEQRELALAPRAYKAIPYPWEGLNEMYHGIRTSELVTITAGTGSGKSTIVKTLAYHVLKATDDETNIGMLMLEEPVRETLRGLMTVSMNKNMCLAEVPDSGVTVTKEEENKAWQDVFNKDRVYVYGEFGSNFIDNIVTDVTYMAQALQCRYIFLDHVSIIVAGQDNGDERKALDEVTVKLRELCHSLDICIFMVCHTKRVVGTSHEEGGQTSLSDLRGTAGIGQMSDAVIGLERDQQAENPFVRNTTVMRVLKNRKFGMTGPAAYLNYDHQRGTVKEIDKEQLDAELAKDGDGEDKQERPVFDNTRNGDDF